MSQFALKQLGNRLHHITASNAANGQLMQIAIQVDTNKFPLLEKAVNAHESFTVEGLSEYGEVIGWNFGRFFSEDVRDVVKERFDVDL